MASLVTTNPWQLALDGDFGPLCKHIRDTIEVADDVEVVGAIPHVPMGLASTVTHVEVLLRKSQGKIFRYKIRAAPPETGEPSLQASTALAQLIMNDPLLLAGVTDFECSTVVSFIVFRGHRVDLSKHFDGQCLNVSGVITKIICKVSTASGTRVCSIGMVPIATSVAFLPHEDNSDGEHRFYEEANIRKWIAEHGTAPFTRATTTEADICVVGPAAVPIAKQPTLPQKRKAVETNKPVVKKARPVKNKHICAVWDRSGSMRSMGATPLEGLKKLLQDQKAIATSSGNPTKVSLYTFDNQMEVPVDNQDILTVDIDDEWIEPRGTTRLYDTIVTAATALKQHVLEGESGVFIVMTDGTDNASECSVSTVKKTLDSMPDNIECIFMAANIGDAQDVGASMGFNEDTSLTFTPDASDAAFRCVSQSAMRSVSGGTAAFTGMERQSSVARTNNVRARTLF